MKIGIIQLSDIHISSEKDLIITNKDLLIKSCKSKLNECTKLIMVITGDIANSGKEEEYKIAYEFLKSIENEIKKEATYVNSFDYAIVPGNHDCNFTSNPVRDIILQTQSQKDNIDHDDIVNMCISPQENFWSFYTKLCGKEIKPSISFEIKIPLTLNSNLCFHCYNSSLYSSIKETPGSLVIPKRAFIMNSKDRKEDIIISLFHHNTGWLTPDTPENNKKIFEYHIFKTSNIVMCGHEHQQVQKIESSLESYNEIVYLESNALQYKNESSYNVLVLETNNNSFVDYTYIFNKKKMLYEETGSFERTLKYKIKGIVLNNEFKDSLIKLDLPIKHPNKSDLSLLDVYVYPDLEPLLDLEEKYGEFIDSERLAKEDNLGKIIFIEGNAQSGKSALLRMLHLSFYNNGLYPIVIHGKDIKNVNIEDIIKRNYKNQYNHKAFSFQEYMQLEKSRHIILIDNFEESTLNDDGTNVILDRLLANFDKIIITTIERNDIKSLLIRDSKESKIRRYRLLSLGYYKRNQIIERWIRLGTDPYTLDKALIEKEIKLTFDQISNLLGEQLIPSYPVYILTLLQSLNQSLKSFDVSQTSYAYCYNSLIIASLLHSKVPSDNIKGIIKFLTELSFHLYDNNIKNIILKDIEDFYIAYSDKYHVSYTTKGLVSILCESNILKEKEEEIYQFTYKYIYYFLVANKISSFVNTDKGKIIIKHLCSNIHKEKEANILIFLIHHNDDNTLIEELLFASMLPFENQRPITLNTTDEVFTNLSVLVDKIKTEVLISDVDPHNERDKALRDTDKIKRIQTEENNNEDKRIIDEKWDEDQNLKDINHTFKVTKILGQIIKNQRETFEKEKIISLLVESYNVCFRSINFFSNMLESNKDDIVDYIVTKNKSDRQQEIDITKLKDKVSTLLKLMLYRVCLSTFANLSLAVGTSRMNEIYDEVALRLGTPAAKIISFTIKTYYSTMKISELEDLAEDFKNNPVATHILKARVINYVYNNYVSFKDKQTIGKICQLQLVNRADLKKIN